MSPVVRWKPHWHLTMASSAFFHWSGLWWMTHKSFSKRTSNWQMRCVGEIAWWCVKHVSVWLHESPSDLRECISSNTDHPVENTTGTYQDISCEKRHRTIRSLSLCPCAYVIEFSGPRRKIASGVCCSKKISSVVFLNVDKLHWLWLLGINHLWSQLKWSFWTYCKRGFGFGYYPLEMHWFWTMFCYAHILYLESRFWLCEITKKKGSMCLVKTESAIPCSLWENA